MSAAMSECDLLLASCAAALEPAEVSLEAGEGGRARLLARW